MQIFRINRLPLFQGPDIAPAAGDPPPVDPAVIANSDPANPPLAPAPQPPAPNNEPPPAAAAEPPLANPEPAPHGNKGKTPWWQTRISEESHRARQAEQRAADAEALLESLRRGANPTPNEPAAATNNNQRQPAADDAAVEARARAIVAQQQIGGVIQAGLSKFADWEQRAAILGSAGAASPDFVMDVIGVDPQNAHVILHQLADDPDKAARLAKMDSRGRTIELVKMSMATNAPAAAAPAKPAEPPRRVSQAPTPPPAVQPTGAQPVDWRSDKASDQDFSRGWDEMMAQRAKRGRR